MSASELFDRSGRVAIAFLTSRASGYGTGRTLVGGGGKPAW